MRRALRANQLPSVAVLAHGDMAAGMNGGYGGGGGGDAPVQALGTVGGARALSEDSLIDALQGVLQHFEPLLVAARAEQNERIADGWRVIFAPNACDFCTRL